MLGYIPDSFSDPDLEYEPHTEAMTEHLKSIKEVQLQVHKSLSHAHQYHTKYYNHKHKPMTFTVRDKVLLSTKNLTTWRPTKKLDNKFVGPFKVIKAVGKLAYKLQLPK